MKTNPSRQLLIGLAALIGLGAVAYVVWPAQQKSVVAVSSPPAGVKAPVWDASVHAGSSIIPVNPASSTQVVKTGSVAVATRTAPPISLVGGRQVEYPGHFAKAQIRVGGKSYQLTPNQLGNFQRIDIDPKAKVSVQVFYPQGSVGDPVSVEAVDGGQLGGKQMGTVIDLDAQQSVQFQFLAGDQEGIYRVVLQNGADVKTVNLWVGRESASN